MKKRKVEDAKIEQDVVDLLQRAGKPATTDFVAKNLKLSWSTARAVLMAMSLRGKISFLETTAGLLFLSKDPPEAVSVE
jgi:hypothetical protein